LTKIPTILERIPVVRLLIPVLAALLLVVSSAGAQTSTPASKLTWDQASVASAAEAQALTYRYYPDGSTTGTTLAGVTCTGTTPVVCQATFPAFTPGAHTLTMTAANAAGESVKSAVFSFTFVVIPAAPGNIRIQ
jgi:hypothetical protein